MGQPQVETQGSLAAKASMTQSEEMATERRQMLQTLADILGHGKPSAVAVVRGDLIRLRAWLSPAALKITEMIRAAGRLNKAEKLMCEPRAAIAAAVTAHWSTY